MISNLGLLLHVITSFSPLNFLSIFPAVTVQWRRKKDACHHLHNEVIFLILNMLCCLYHVNAVMCHCIFFAWLKNWLYCQKYIYRQTPLIQLSLFLTRLFDAVFIETAEGVRTKSSLTRRKIIHGCIFNIEAECANDMFCFQVVTYFPVTLFPTPVPKAAFLQALAVQTHYNTLVDKISQDPDFLEEALTEYEEIVGGMSVLLILLSINYFYIIPRVNSGLDPCLWMIWYTRHGNHADIAICNKSSYESKSNSKVQCFIIMIIMMICLFPHHSTIQADDFTARLFGIYRQVQQEGRAQVRFALDLQC